jgi:hypothetical protein
MLKASYLLKGRIVTKSAYEKRLAQQNWISYLHFVPISVRF